MNADFIKLVHKIKADRGPTILTDVRTLRSLLADYAKGAYKGERRNFLLALEDGLVERIQSESDISEAFLRTQASFFASTYSFTEDAAQFVVWGWAEVLGLHVNGKPVLLRDAGSVSAAEPQAVSAGSSANQARPSVPPRTPNTELPAITGNSHTNSIGMELMLIPAGSFMMGSPKSEKNRNRYADELLHKVIFTQPFYLGKFPVTQAQWQAVTGNNPSNFEGWTRPVERVSWEDTQDFIKKLNQKEGTNGYRLPTEAEWEYAARAGSQTAYCFGNDESQLKDYAWYRDNSDKQTHPVGQKKPNAWGLHDMHGNVWEWCQDWYGKNYYHNSSSSDPKGPSSGESRVLRNVWEWCQDWYGKNYYRNSSSSGPKGPSSGESRVLRGGSWDYSARYCWSANRNFNSPGFQYNSLGFRLAFSPGQ